MIRLAKFTEIPILVEIAKEAIGLSRYKDMELKIGSLKLTIINFMNEESSVVFVSENNGGLDGVFVGVIAPIYGCIETHIATNIHWYTRPGTHASVSDQLLDAFMEWGGSLGVETLYRISIADNFIKPELAKRYMRRKGFIGVGHVFEKEEKNGN